VANSQKQQTSAIQAELPHGFRLGALAGEEQIGFSFSLF
jgi:hypothetical protein